MIYLNKDHSILEIKINRNILPRAGSCKLIDSFIENNKHNKIKQNQTKIIGCYLIEKLN